MAYTNDGPDREPDHSTGMRYLAYEHAFSRESLKDGRVMQCVKRHVRDMLKKYAKPEDRIKVTHRRGHVQDIYIIRTEWRESAYPARGRTKE
jgi:hypothetical protein